jgi:hypothetical protein
VSAHPDDVPLASAPAWLLALLRNNEGVSDTLEAALHAPD